MLVAEIANPSRGDYVIDMCAAPGGKSLHMGDKMEGFGTVDARDISQYKVNLIEENIQRTGSINVQAKVQDATLFDVESECKADIVLADVPCSGYGVIGKKPEINLEKRSQLFTCGLPGGGAAHLSGLPGTPRLRSATGECL